VIDGKDGLLIVAISCSVYVVLFAIVIEATRRNMTERQYYVLLAVMVLVGAGVLLYLANA